MKLKNKLSILAISVITAVPTTLAHSGEDSGTASGMMWGDGMMHSAGHMTGYNMWGLGWFGTLFGIAFWILVVLGIIYLYQEIKENEGAQQND